MARAFSVGGLARGLGAGAAVVALALAGLLLWDRGRLTEAEPPEAPTQLAEPAAVPAPEDAAQAEETAPDAQPETLPRFDLVRVDPESGMVTVAGQARPGARVAVLVDGAEAEAATADATGSFAVLFALEHGDAPRAISLSMEPGEGAPVASGETLLITALRPRPVTEATEPEAIAAAEAPDPDPDPEPVAEAGADAAPESRTEAPALAGDTAGAGTGPAPAPEPVAEADAAEDGIPATMADAEAPAEGAPRTPEAALAAAAPSSEPALTPAPEGGLAEAAAADAPRAPEETLAAAAPSSEPAPTPAPTPAPEVGLAEAPATPGAPPASALDTEVSAEGRVAGQAVSPAPDAPAAATDPAGVAEAAGPAETAAPAMVIVGEGGLRVLPPPELPGQPREPRSVMVDAIGYGETGDVQIAGRGTGGAAVRLYIDNRLVETVAMGAGGDWTSALPEVDTGVYTLRVDEIDAGGAVISRFETPFLREDPAVLAAAAAQPPAPGGADEAAGPAGEAPRAQVVTVQPGYTLWGIAERTYGSGFLFVQVFRANRDQIRNPDLIYPGQVFTLPEIPDDVPRPPPTGRR